MLNQFNYVSYYKLKMRKKRFFFNQFFFGLFMSIWQYVLSENKVNILFEQIKYLN